MVKIVLVLSATVVAWALLLSRPMPGYTQCKHYMQEVGRNLYEVKFDCSENK